MGLGNQLKRRQEKGKLQRQRSLALDASEDALHRVDEVEGGTRVVLQRFHPVANLEKNGIGVGTDS